MSGLFAIAIAIVIFALLYRAYRPGTPRLIYLTIVAGFCYWYWLPAANLLTYGYIGLDNFYVTSAVDDACWLVLLSQVTLLGFLLLVQPLFADPRSMIASKPQARIPVLRLAQLCVASALAYLMVRFASHDSSLLTELWTGEISARSKTSFFNRSESATSSLLALWEIATLWIALFCTGWCVVERRTLTSSGLAGFAAIALLFVGSGTRSILLQALFVGLVATLFRTGTGQVHTKKIVTRIALSIIPLAAFGSAIIAAFSARFEGDGGYAAAGPEAAILATIFVNNDMMRELAFSIQNMQPSLEGVWDFVRTPFTFMMPTFLGFQKDIPAHLVFYNWRRSGIDIEGGVGNVFPGLIADFWLVFGHWAPVMFALFAIFFAFSVDRLARAIPNAQSRMVYRLAGLSYLFISFRNVSGGLVLVQIIGIGILLGSIMRLSDTRKARQT